MIVNLLKKSNNYNTRSIIEVFTNYRFDVCLFFLTLNWLTPCKMGYLLIYFNGELTNNTNYQLLKFYLLIIY